MSRHFLVRRSLLKCVVALSALACGSDCEQSCSPLLVVRGIPESGAFPDGDIEFEVRLGEDTTRCTVTLPDDFGTVLCGPLRVTHSQQQVCVDEVIEDITVVRCTESGAWSQGIFIDEPTEEVFVREVYPDGRVLEETFTPEYETTAPEASNCSNCPRTEVSWDLP